LTKPFSGLFRSSQPDAFQGVKDEEVIVTYNSQLEESVIRDDISMTSHSILAKRSAVQRSESDVSLT
jgi:hypothetical protein